MTFPGRRGRATIAGGARVLQLLVALLGLAALAGCGGRPPPLPPLATDAKVVAFGDSLTAGVGAATREAYPAQLQTLIGREVVNAGISGETTAEGRARLASVLDEHEPQLVILCEGGNDLMRKLDRAAMKANLAGMIEILRARGIAVVLIGVPQPALLDLEAAPEYSELAERYAVPVENEVIARVLGDRSRKSDPIHPNAQGYREIAEAVARLLDRAGAV